MKLAGLFRSSWLVKQAAVGLLVGPLMAGYAVMNRVPQEAQLTHVVGVVETGKKAATKRRRGGEDVHYEFDVRSDTGKPFKLRVPSDDLSDQDMRAVLAAKVIEAKFDGASDVFRADGRWPPRADLHKHARPPTGHQ